MNPYSELNEVVHSSDCTQNSRFLMPYLKDKELREKNKKNLHNLE